MTSGDRLAAYKATRSLEFATSSIVLPTIIFDKDLWIDLGVTGLHLVFLRQQGPTLAVARC